MRLKPITVDYNDYPSLLHPYLTDAPLYDSSCSPDAKVIFIDKGQGYFLKSAAAGSLKKEAEMTRYFHEKGFAAEVVTYSSDNFDWLLTAKVPGNDCIAAKYLEQPERLCDVMAETLARLHGSEYSGCPVRNHTERYLHTAESNYRAGHYDISLFPDNWGYQTPEEAYRVVKTKGSFLQTDTLLHGDYCLPNIILDNWKFSGFIDLDSGGVGDRHVDLFWGLLTLNYNLKTDKYSRRFVDAYGRDKVDIEKLRLIAAIEVFG